VPKIPTLCGGQTKATRAKTWFVPHRLHVKQRSALTGPRLATATPVTTIEVSRKFLLEAVFYSRIGSISLAGGSDWDQVCALSLILNAGTRTITKSGSFRPILPSSRRPGSTIDRHMQGLQRTVHAFNLPTRRVPTTLVLCVGWEGWRVPGTSCGGNHGQGRHQFASVSHLDIYCQIASWPYNVIPQ
jgi:hypothetical protein